MALRIGSCCSGKLARALQSSESAGDACRALEREAVLTNHDDRSDTLVSRGAQ